MAKKDATDPETLGAGCLTAFGALWVLILIVIDGLMLIQFTQVAYALKNYEPVPAIITKSETNRSAGSTTYFTEIEFDYKINGKQFSGDRYAVIESSTSSPEYAQQRIDQYPVGASVTAHYDPASPDRAVLELDDSSYPYIAMLFVTPFHCVGLGLLVGGISTTRRKRRDPHHAKIAGYIIRRNSHTLVLHDAFWPKWNLFTALFGVTTSIASVIILISGGINPPGSIVIAALLFCFVISIVIPTVLNLKRARSETRLTFCLIDGWLKRGNTNQRLKVSSIARVMVNTRGVNPKNKRHDWYMHTINAVDTDGNIHTLLIGKGQRHRGKELRSWFESEFENFPHSA